MANFANPTVGSAYTSFPTEIRDAVTAALQQLHVGSHTNIPTNSIKWDASDNRWKKYNGSAFVDLTSTYAFNAQISATQLNLGDAQKIILGQHNDLEIVHDGSNSVIREVGTGGLFLQSNDSIFLGQTNGTTQYIEASSTDVVLRVGGGEKFRVNSGGAILGDNVPLRIGNGVVSGQGDLVLRHDTNNSYIEDTGTGALIFKSNTYSFRNAADSEQIAVFNEGGHVALYHANSPRLFTQSYGVAIDGDALLVANSTASAKRIEIRYGTNFTARLEASAVGVFQIQAYSGTAWYPAIEVNANGTVEINHSSNATKRLETTASGVKVTQLFLADSTNSNDNAVIFGDQSDMRIYHDGNSGVLQNDTGAIILQNGASNANGIFIKAKAGEHGIIVNHNGGVLLYYDGGSTPKLETVNTGVTIRTSNSNPVLSTWETTSGLILDGSFAAGIAFKDGTSGGATMFVHSSGLQWALRMAAAGGTPENAITADRNAAVKLHFDGSPKLETTGSGCAIDGNLHLNFSNNKIELNSSDGSIEIRRAGGDPFIDFKVNNVDNEARLVLLSGQNNKIESTTGYFVGDYTAGSNVKYFSAGNSQDLQLYHDGGHSVIKNNTQNLYYVTQHTHVFQNLNAVINAQFESNGRCLLTHAGAHCFQTTAKGVLVLGQNTNPFGTAWNTDCAVNINGAHGGGISITDGTTGGVIQAVTNAGLDYYLRFGAVNGTPLNVIYARRGGRIAFFHTLSGVATEQFATSQFGIQVRHPNGTTTNRNPAYGTALIDGTQSNPVLKSYNLGVTDHGTGDYEVTFANHGGTHTVSVFGNSFNNFIPNDGHGNIYVTSESATQVRFIICREVSSGHRMDKTRLSVAIFSS